MPVDPTSLSPEQLTGEIQKVVKALLGTGARLPKPLMLFVKNLVFLDGAIATLAPDLDIFAEIATIALYFGQRHGDRIAAEAGLGPSGWDLDLSALQASVGVDPAAASAGLTHRELQERRDVLRAQLGAAPRRLRLTRLGARRRGSRSG
jgi:ubiquinone biosynthesis protein